MTQNRRIVLNIVATYGRSMYALVLGLFTARWALLALGQVDYGLYGVVGGLTAFIAFFNGILSSSIGRFYAYSVGAATRHGNEVEGLSECRRWFSVAVSIHTVIPIVLVVVGYPIGAWAIEHWLTIPPERVADCVWVFRVVCFTCFCGMVSVPFSAMYTAKQEIAELTVYSFATATLHAAFLYYMITHPGVWLCRYALWVGAITVLPMLIITIRALIVYRECRINVEHLWNLRDIKELLQFASWNLFGATGNLIKSAGMTVLVNKVLGPTRNAAAAVANSVSGHTQTLAGSLVGAFMPAITNAYGAGDRVRVASLIHRTCKFGALLSLPFSIPLSLESEEVMILWLKEPPAGAASLCVWLMAVMLFENMTAGLWVGISACGKIALYQSIVGVLFVLTLPLAWALMLMGFDLNSVGGALLGTLLVVVVVRLYFARKLLSLSLRRWVFQIFFPVFTAIITALAIGSVPRFCMSASFLRVCITTVLCVSAILPLGWMIVLDGAERAFVSDRFHLLRTKLTGNG